MKLSLGLGIDEFPVLLPVITNGGSGNTLSITAPDGYAGRNNQFPRDIKNTISFADSADDGSGLYTVTLSLGGSKALTRAGWTGSPGATITRTSQTLATINAELVAALDLPAYTTEYQAGNNIRIVRDADSVELNKSFGVAAFAPLVSTAFNNDVADGTLLDTVLPDVPGMVVSITNYTATLDETAPTVSSSTPADNATDVAITVNPTITFSENIAFGTGNITLRANDGGWADLETFDVTTNTGGGAGTVSISGGVLTIEPTADLDNSIEYAIRIDATAITDQRENAFAGIADDTTISFTTIAGDVVSPSISSSVPADNATDVAVDATITVTFNENVRFITSAGTFTLRDNDGGFADLEVFTPTTASAATGAGGGSASISGAVLTITPGADFAGGIEHALRFASNVIEDLAGNDFAGIADDTTLSFTAIAAASVTRTHIFSEIQNRAYAGTTSTYSVPVTNGTIAVIFTSQESMTGVTGITIDGNAMASQVNVAGYADLFTYNWTGGAATVDIIVTTTAAQNDVGIHVYNLGSASPTAKATDTEAQGFSNTFSMGANVASGEVAIGLFGYSNTALTLTSGGGDIDDTLNNSGGDNNFETVAMSTATTGTPFTMALNGATGFPNRHGLMAVFGT